MSTDNETEAAPAALIVSTVTAVVSLACGTFAVIHHIDTVYRPNMGFWAWILIAFATVAAIPVAVVTFFFVRLAIIKGSHLYLPAFILSLTFLFSASSIIAWVQANSFPFLLTYGILGGLIASPPCLFGFAISGLVIKARFTSVPMGR